MVGRRGVTLTLGRRGAVTFAGLLVAVGVVVLVLLSGGGGRRPVTVSSAWPPDPDDIRGVIGEVLMAAVVGNPNECTVMTSAYQQRYDTAVSLTTGRAEASACTTATTSLYFALAKQHRLAAYAARQKRTAAALTAARIAFTRGSLRATVTARVSGAGGTTTMVRYVLVRRNDSGGAPLWMVANASPNPATVR